MDVKRWKELFPRSRCVYPVVFPVIHVENTEQVCRNILAVKDKAIGGVFLINHGFGYPRLVPIIRHVRSSFPDLWVGVNFLGITADVAVPILEELQGAGCRVDGYWADDACIDERVPYVQTKANRISKVIKDSSWDGLYLGGVAFKKQREVAVEDYRLSAQIAFHFMDLVCTSGTKTGSAPDLAKILALRDGCGSNKPLAVASGMTPDNVAAFAPHLDCILIATGVSKDFHNIEPALLDKLLESMRSSIGDVGVVRPPAWYLSLIAASTKGPTKAWLDPSAIYANGEAFKDLITDLTSPFPPSSYDIVVGIDGMGFPAGGAIAHKHNKGFVVVRKAGKLCVETTSVSFTDYSKQEKGLELRAIQPFPEGSRVLIVDQWVETGGTMLAAIDLVERSGGVVAGVTAICIERNFDQVLRLKADYKCHEVVAEGIHHLFDRQEYRTDVHSNLLYTS